VDSFCKLPQSLEPIQENYCLGSFETAKNLVDYYNRNDWKDKKGKKGKLDDEYIGYLSEWKLNSKGLYEELTTVWGEVTIDMTVAQISETLEDINQMFKIDEYLKTSDLVEVVTDFLKIYKICFKSILVIASRETLISLGIYRFPNGITLYAGTSVEHKDVPEKKDPVRASIFVAGWILIPL